MDELNLRRSMNINPPIKEHLIIGGTGRAGTTMLVQLLTTLGFETGFTPEEANNKVDPISHAGLEHHLSDPNLPYVIKSPWFSEQIGDALQNHRIKLAAAIVPVRNLYSAAASRRRVFEEAQRQGLNPKAHPGSLWKVENPEDQEAALAVEFYQFVYPLIANGIPMYFLHFPKFVMDPKYCFDALQPIFESHGVTRDAALAAHAKVSRVEYVHQFDR